MIKNIIFSILMIICSLKICAEVPNEIINKNPKKEVTTITSEKNRDHANMSITVNKVNIIDILGSYNANGEIEFNLPDSTNINLDEIKVINHIENGMNKRSRRSITSEKSIEVPFSIEKNEKNTVVKVNQQEFKDKVYILELDKNNKQIKRVYAGKTSPDASEFSNIDQYVNPNLIRQLVIQVKVSGSEILDAEYHFGGLDGFDTNKFTIFDNTARGLSHISGGHDFQREIISKVGDLSDRINVDKRLRLTLVSRTQPIQFRYDSITPSTIKPVEYNFGTLVKDAYSILNFSTLSFPGLSDAASVIAQITYKFLPQQNAYKKNGGVFFKEYEPTDSVVTKWSGTQSHAIKVPQMTYLVVPRRAREVTIEADAQKANANNVISFKDLGLFEKLGYAKGNEYYYRITSTSSNGGPSPTFDRDIGGMYFHPSLKQGTYIIEAEWAAVLGKKKYPLSAFYDGTPSSDRITINYIYNEEDLGEIIFNVDKRIVDARKAVNSNKTIIDAQGRNFAFQNSSQFTFYPEFVRVDGEFKFKNDPVNKITDVTKVEGRPVKATHYTNNLKAFFKGDSDYEDESIITYNVYIRDLKRKSAISFYNKSYTENEFLNNRFTLKGKNDPRRNFYGNIKENYINNEYREATAKLDMKNSKLYALAKWQPEITGNNNVSNEAILNIKSGKLFNTRGIRGNKSIVTHLVVKENGKELGNINGNINAEGVTKGENLEVETTDNIIGIDGKTGELYVKKLTHNHKTRNYEIEVFYQDISLGKLKLDVENGYGFSLVDSGIIDFGELFQGETVKKLSYLKVTNPLKYKIDIKIAENSKNGKMYLKTDPQYMVPLINSEVVHMNSSGKEIETFQLSTTAAVPKDAKTGQYEGELEVVITILPKK